MVTAGYNPATGKALFNASSLNACEGCCGGLSCEICDPEITVSMPAEITAEIQNAVINSSDFPSAVASAVEQEITLTQSDCDSYSGSLTWSDCNGPLMYTSGSTKHYLNSLTIDIEFDLTGMCSDPQTYKITITSCFDSTAEFSGVCGGQGIRGKVIYRYRSGITPPDTDTLVGLSLTITESDSVESGYCFTPADGVYLSEFDLVIN
jgi:hypothetical protein